jgi:hypothetical protein
MLCDMFNEIYEEVNLALLRKCVTLECVCDSYP